PTAIKPLSLHDALPILNERQILDRETQAAELGAQRFEALEFVAINGRSFELHLAAQPLHLRAQHVDRTIVRSIQKRARQAHSLVVLRRRAAADAGPEAFRDLVADAARGPRQLKKLGLIAVKHLEVRAAIPEHQRVVELT